MGRKERISHRKPWTFGSHKPDSDVIDTYYEQGFNKDYVAYDDNGEVIAVCKDKKRLRRFLKGK